MKCHYCGKEVWLVRHLLDGDFCSPAHRKKYHDRLRRSLESLPSEEGPPGPVAGFQFEMPPMDSSGLHELRYAGFQSTRPGMYPPKYVVTAAPLFGQTFFGPTLATAAAPPTAHAPAMLEPLACPPALGVLSRGWTLAAGAVGSAHQPMMLGAVQLKPGAPPIPIYAPPAVLDRAAQALHCPKLALGVLFTDGRGGDALGPVSQATAADLRRTPLASWTRTVLEAVGSAPAQPAATGPVEQAEAAIATRNGSALHLAPCLPAAFLAPLLAPDTVAAGSLLIARAETPLIERPATMRLPALRPVDRAQPAREENAIWKIQPASPWNLAQASAPEVLACAPAAATLPTLKLAPVRPGLAAEWETRTLAAPPAEVAPAAAQGPHTALDTPERPALPPHIAVPAAAVLIPQAVRPRPLSADLVSPQTQDAAPVAAPEMPMAAASTRAPSLEGYTPASSKGLLAAGPVAHAVAASVPQAAAPRSAGEPLASPSAAHTALPVGTTAGFAWKPFAAVAPQAAQRKLEPIVPAPVTVAAEPVRFREPVPPVSIIGLPAAAGEIPLDVYVQRVRSVPKRECAWRDLPVSVAAPTALPGVQPSRFEQLVLQDWRRRYPARQVSAPPAPIDTGSRVLPMARRLSALARLQRNAPHFIKATAAALFLGAVIWMGVSSHSVRNTITADRQWLKTAIAKRATLVLDDNFHSGLNLWEGRKDWARSWSYSHDGFMRTGQLALYHPTLKMDNYRLEFFAQIEAKSVGWVFRAKDEQNYYAMKLSVTEPGPRPLVSVVRYPVLEGKKGKRVQIPLPIMMHNNTPYHVALDVKGTRFRTFIEDQEVDSWNDDKLLAGGVGFFSESGEHARLYWVKVSNNTDWLGRLCGMLSGGEKGQNNEAGLWNPADPQSTVAVLDPGAALEGAKNADRKRGASMLPFAEVRS